MAQRGSTYQPLRRFRRNRRGTDYVVGDIHGEFSQLRARLDELRFDARVDRLFSVGDLVDRGSDSLQVLDWLGRRWFHAIRGNHENAVVSLDAAELDSWLETNGGEWWFDVEHAVQQRIRGAFAALPYLIEVATAKGKVGIVHADVPSGQSWREFARDVVNDRHNARENALWGRMTATKGTRDPIADVYSVYCGHTPLDRPQQIENMFLIDTGACFGGKLTVVPLEPLAR